MFEVKNRVLSGALDENIDTLTAAVSMLGALQGLCLLTAPQVGSFFDDTRYNISGGRTNERSDQPTKAIRKKT